MFMNQPWPDGVLDMAPVRRDTVKVVFDPHIIGARDLVERRWKDRVSLATAAEEPGLAAGRKHVSHLGYMTLLSAVLTVPVLVMAWAPLPERELVYGSASLVLATIVQAVIAGPFYPKALKALVFSRVIEMDLLIVLSTSAAYIFSVVSFGYLAAKEPLSTGQFFETSTLLVTLIMVGRYVAALARQKAVESISMRSLQAENVLLVVDGDASKTETVDARLLQYGDTFKVLPETRIPTDGFVLSGSSEVDESILTGESLPVEKSAASPVIAGTVNGSGTLTVRLSRLPSDNTIATIAAMVDEAKLSKPKMQELADKVATYFVPVVVGLTMITFAIWVAVGMAIQEKSGSEAAVQAITYAVTVLIVSCPCAVGLAVPMVIVIASGIAAEHGVIFKSANAIETARRTTHLVLDKTGTLTQGKLSVAAEKIPSDSQNLSLLLGLIADNKHPVSVAVANHLRSKNIVVSPVREVKSLVGKGVIGLAGDKTLRAGNSRWLDVSHDHTVQAFDAQEHTVFCFSVDGQLAATFGLKDSLRPDAQHVVRIFQQQGIPVHIVSGDGDGPIRSVASELGIPTSQTQSRSTPTDKQAYIKRLLEQNAETEKPVVVFCGDGANDAIAFAQATIGVHMHEGSHVAQSAADVVLMRPGLTGLVTMKDVSKASVRRINFNFTWALAYNTFAVLLAAGAFVNARIPPQYAGLGELVSVLPVISAAVLMRWAKIWRES
ncbi:ATPase, P-type, heavy metal translocating [Metarhizium rileyi]|uniref:ATPase, P-type, heavy metal translocating n=1 Tax=Metarhizium rileyi (strain RCEF 4871) TaxID=1649241 RepID=A0A167KEY3_METRR|nr:ATPase, P-type, heavy metal translocating [Metarhizium rileyi RCEF 4871]